MGRIIDLTAGNLGQQQQEIQSLRNSTPLNNSSIGRGGIEIYDGGVLNISNGGLVVNGSAQIIGTLNADGTINMTGLFIASGEMQLNGTVIATGDFNIDGPLIVDGNTTFNGTLGINGVTTITGDTTLTGKFVTNGPVDINGLTTLTGDLVVTGAGKIKAGVTQINPDGTISFGTGKRVTPDNGFGYLALESGAASLQLTPANTDYHAQFSGGAYFQGLIHGMGLRLAALPTTTQPANLHIDSSGNVSRSTA